MTFQQTLNLSIFGGLCLLGYIAYLLANQPHYQIAAGGEVVWKLDTQTGQLQRCYPKVEALPNIPSYIEVVCDPDN
ncbi:MAG: hypothetical protein B7Z75_13250 [Acidocella sp. 20-57-95]|nr:MAG: hypothetical protein B7Z75_13250 [Acidocella sp. 20-57-95]